MFVDTVINLAYKCIGGERKEKTVLVIFLCGITSFCYGLLF